ncbi:hypothetical protein [Leptospira alstonii]|uniref:Uncharacterized protein n=2 Tax=Leptospira alstonii TaxID=28452 RepID=M6CT89_9LEPT|nr:hypothetical protein [Leptospira alstonii]EMJ94919.1 hypothetical protein LEP1GSC194_2195 [Leptospira alstonii serovar Sichuan str. 79601]EQA80650.1 hypothetical protein LEP1GSC193_0407 [Leptospira alstonii serovar Pingchang str. 80-412]
MNWQSYSYYDWNDTLCNAIFAISDSERPTKQILRIPSSMYFLASLVDASSEENLVANTFIQSITFEMSSGQKKSFCSFACSLAEKEWDTDSKAPPPFFGLLWLTCAASYGYPEPDNHFHANMRNILGIVSEFSRLNDLWEKTQIWVNKSSKGFIFFLPPKNNYRKNVGYSWMLSFPQHRDRRILQEIFSQEGFTGDLPPLMPTERLLQQNKTRFSEEFREYFDSTRKDNFANSDFWETIANECLYGNGPSGKIMGKRPNRLNERE